MEEWEVRRKREGGGILLMSLEKAYKALFVPSSTLDIFRCIFTFSESFQNHHTALTCFETLLVWRTVNEVIGGYCVSVAENWILLCLHFLSILPN